MRRREFLATVGSVMAWPSMAEAQPRQTRRLGVLMGYPEYDTEAQRRLVVFTESLRELGWVQGRNIDLLIRFVESDPERVRAAARDFMEAAAEVILSNPAPVIPTLLPLIGSIPVVFANIPDPVGIGLVSSLARPGGNVTGVTNFEPALAGKWLELLKEIAPTIARIGVVYDPSTPAWGERLHLLRSVAPSMGLQLAPIAVRSHADLEVQLGVIEAEPATGLIILPGMFTTVHRKTIVALASKRRLPAIYPFRYFVTEGGLISYGVETEDQFRLAASYVDRILKGERAGDLPVQAPTKFEMVINLATAKAFGIEIPASVLARADELIG